MGRLPALRRWQREALERFEKGDARDFLAVATPGAGKTVFALTAARRALVARSARGVVIVVPTAHLKNQWADAAEAFDLLVDPGWNAREGVPRDHHGVVVTYQQIAANPEAVAQMSRGAFGILDEIHHAGESRSWGESVRLALGPAARRLCISGTPFRSDDVAIPFVAYRGIEAQPDYEYGYGQALQDRAVVRPVYFPRVGGHMEWRAPDGREFASSFEDALGGTLASQRLRTALSLDGEWLPAVLAQAHQRLVTLRETDAAAGGLVIATDQDHARGIAHILRRRTGAPVVVATSDDPGASDRIAAFRDSRDPWLVAVRMVSEGVDIPRLRVGVYATTTATDLFFRQAVGRLVRWSRQRGPQGAYLFIPDDARIRAFAFDIKTSRRHALRPPEAETEREVRDLDPAEGEKEDQLDLFAVIAAHATEAAGEFEEHDPWDEDYAIAEEEAWAAGQESHELDRAPVPPPTLAGAPAQAPRTARARRQALRESNQDRVIALARLTQLSHAEINRSLNRRIGLKRISDATLRDLQRRLEAADRWIQNPKG